MFKNKFLGILLALGTIVILPTVAVAQTTEDDLLYEDTSLDWEYDWDYDDSYDYDFDSGAAVASAGALAAVMGVILIPALVIGLAVYVYTSLAYMEIAKKLNHPNPWFAWVPILNFVLILQLADMSPWLILLALIPGVNGIAMLILSVMTMMKICEKRGMDKNLGFLMLVPVANLVLPGILAWKKE
jgi:hypothetical protein